MIECSNNSGSPRKAVSLLLPFLSTCCEDLSQIQNAIDVIEQGGAESCTPADWPPRFHRLYKLTLVKPTVAPNVALFGCTCLRCSE